MGTPAALPWRSNLPSRGVTAHPSHAGWVGEREIAPAWYGGAPSFVALHVRAVGLRAFGRPWSRSIALEARGGLAGL